MKSRSLASRVQAWSNGINGAVSNPIIMEAIKPFGYDEQKMDEGIKMLEKVRGHTALQRKEYGDKLEASNEVSVLFDACYSKYMVRIKVARIALKDEIAVLISTKATGRRRRSYSGFISDAHVFYSNLLKTPHALDILSKFGMPQESLEDDFAELIKFEEAYHVFLKETGEAQQATKDRDKAIDELALWYSDFRAIARIALYDRPQLLEGLGIVVKS